MMSHEPEPPKIAFGSGNIDIAASIKDVRKVLGTLRQQDSPDLDQDDISAAQTALCCSHFLSTWGQVFQSAYSFIHYWRLLQGQHCSCTALTLPCRTQRMWEFSIGLILLELRPDSLALVALFGLVDSLAKVIAGPYIGAYVDGYVMLLLYCRNTHPRRSICLCCSIPLHVCPDTCVWRLARLSRMV